MKRKWVKKGSKLVYSNPWFNISEDAVVKPDGKPGTYVFLDKPPSNFIITLDDKKSIYLIKEERYPIGKSVIQLPAGVAEDEDNLHQAQKELFEETGIIAGKWNKIGGFYVAPGHETTFINVFLATKLNLSGLKTGNQENNEAIQEIIKVNTADLKKMIASGKISCGISLAAINIFFIKYDVKHG